MPLEKIRIEGFRCLTAVDIELHQARNYLFGRNGAGKTSFLEAIYLLGRGRSFRTRQNRRLIQHGSNGFSIYGEYRTDTTRRRLGVALDADGFQVRLDGESARGMSALATVLPVHVIEPKMHRLMESVLEEQRAAGPASRPTSAQEAEAPPAHRARPGRRLARLVTARSGVVSAP